VGRKKVEQTDKDGSSSLIIAMRMDLSFRLLEQYEAEAILPFLELLNPGLAKEVLLQRLSEMNQQGYICVGGYMGGQLIAISGLWILNKAYVGRHIEPDNVVVHPDYRSTGVGEKMMQWIFNYGRDNGCIASELNCYTSNNAALRFYLNQGYDVLGFHLQKKL
jgi:GNAT superfamily N-acetyltransferase